MMSQRDDKEEEEFSNWAKAVLGLKKARDGSINHIKSKLEPFVDKLKELDSEHSANEREHFKDLLIKVAVNGEVKKRHLDKRNKNKFEWFFDSNGCTTCDRIFKEQIDILEKEGWCYCKTWLKSSTKEQVEPSSYWWVIAKMYMFKSKVIDADGPKEVEPLAIFNLIKHCKLFDSNLSIEVDNVILLRHRLMHSTNNRLNEKDMSDNFRLIKEFLQRVADKDNQTETIDEVEKLETSTLVLYEKNGEFSEEIKEALQLQGESLTADLKSPEGIRGAVITSLAASNMTIKQQEKTYKDREKQLNEQYKDVLTKNEKFERKNAELKEKLNQNEFQIHTLERKLYEMEINKANEDNIRELKNIITNLSQECEQRKTELCSLDEKMEEKINDLKQEKSKHDREISSLKSIVDKEISDLKQEKSKQDEEICSLKSTMEEEINDLKEEKRKYYDEISSLKTTMEKEINDLKEEKRKHYDEIYFLKTTTEREIKDLKQEKSAQEVVIHDRSSTSELSTNQTYQVHSVYHFNVRVDSDEKNCHVRDMCLMPDGTVILLDILNKKLKRLDDKFNVKDFYKFDETPVSVVSVSSSQVVVLDKSGKLTYLTILEKIVHEKIVALEEEKNPMCMIYFKDQFWILCMDGVHIYSLSGSLVKQILNDFIRSHFFFRGCSLITDEEKTRVYFVNGSTVRVLDPDGKIVSPFQLKDDAYAITVTTDGYLLVLESESRNIAVYDTCNNLGVLMFSTSLLTDPCSLLYDGKKGCLIVGSGRENKVQVFQLNK